MKENSAGEKDIKEDLLQNDPEKESMTSEESQEEQKEKVVSDTDNTEMTQEDFLKKFAELQSELEKCQKEKEDITIHLQRLQAEFDNFRKRTKKEKEELIKTANFELLEETLPILDNFERALENGKDQLNDNPFYEGVKMIYNGLFNIMEKYGLKTIETVGCQFDPNKHQAVMQVEASDEYPDNIIVEEMQKGYLLNNKVLRPAMVKVAKDN